MELRGVVMGRGYEETKHTSEMVGFYLVAYVMWKKEMVIRYTWKKGKF